MAAALMISAAITAQTQNQYRNQSQTQLQTQTQVQDPVQAQTQVQAGDQVQLQTKIQARQQLKLQDGSCLIDPAKVQARTNTARQTGNGAMARSRARIQDPATCPNAMIRNNVRNFSGGRR